MALSHPARSYRSLLTIIPSGERFPARASHSSGLRSSSPTRPRSRTASATMCAQVQRLTKSMPAVLSVPPWLRKPNATVWGAGVQGVQHAEQGLWTGMSDNNIDASLIGQGGRRYGFLVQRSDHGAIKGLRNQLFWRIFPPLFGQTTTYNPLKSLML